MAKRRQRVKCPRGYVTTCVPRTEASSVAARTVTAAGRAGVPSFLWRGESFAGTPQEHHADFVAARHEALSSLQDANNAMLFGQCLPAGAHIDNAYVEYGRMVANAYEGPELAEAARVRQAISQVDKPFEQQCVRSEPVSETHERTMRVMRPGLADGSFTNTRVDHIVALAQQHGHAPTPALRKYVERVLRQFPAYDDSTIVGFVALRRGAGTLAGTKAKHRSFDYLDWRDPASWPATFDIAGAAHDFRVMLSDNMGLYEGTFPILKLQLHRDVYVPPVEGDDDRDMDESGNPSDAYMVQLTEAMRQGQPFPPIVVGNDAGNKGAVYGWPYDGRHRLNAAMRLGITTVPAIDITGVASTNGLGRLRPTR